MIEVLEREGNQVLWRYNGLDGVSSLIRVCCGARAYDAELCDSGVLLVQDTRCAIKAAVNKWLDESGEGMKWKEKVDS
ncbi:MAG: hypothetical protein ACYS7Y_04395 [Planctomycetota bacterium]|jgi:hypothetical protein